MAWPRVSSQRYVENVELVRELFLSRKRSGAEEMEGMDGKRQTNLLRLRDIKLRDKAAFARLLSEIISDIICGTKKIIYIYISHKLSTFSLALLLLM